MTHQRTIRRIKRTCAECGDTYAAYGHKSRFCSRTCQGAARARLHELPLTPDQERLVTEAMNMRMRGVAGKLRIEEPGLAWLAFRRAARNWHPKRGPFRVAVHSALVSVASEENRRWFKTRQMSRNIVELSRLKAFDVWMGHRQIRTDELPSAEKLLGPLATHERVIVKCLADGLTLREAGLAVGLTESRVSQIRTDIQWRTLARLTHDEARALGMAHMDRTPPPRRKSKERR